MTPPHTDAAMMDPGTEASFRDMLTAICLTPAQRTAIQKPPFPWFGGKSRAAPLIWQRFGDLPNFVDPFFGSGAVLFYRPSSPKIETINDKDGYVANFFRALQHDPAGVATYADAQVNENDLHAKHLWLVSQKSHLVSRLEGDPEYYDVKIAGWWVWGICSWIGGGFCSGKGPWGAVDGQLVHLGSAGVGVQRQLVHLGDAGRGVHRQLVHLGNAGRGVHRKLVHLGNAGQGVHRKLEHLLAYFTAFAERLRSVRVCCGDWTRVLGETPTIHHGLTGVVLDPPYSAEANRDESLYQEDDLTVAHDVSKWAREHGDNPLFRIALCGYSGEHEMPDTWDKVAWKANGGYGSQGAGRGRENASREVIWFSPYCLQQQQSILPFLPKPSVTPPQQSGLFGETL